MTFDRSRSAGYLANHLARLFAHALARRIAPLGLAPAQFMTLLELWETDGLTQRELVERLDVEQATMANTLTRMERDGLIERTPHAADRRARAIRLTARGRALQEAATREATATNEAALGGLDPSDQEALIRLMSSAIKALRQDRAARTGPNEATRP